MGHHLILGHCCDYLTGETLEDTHDEQYRQKIARLLVETLSYPRDAIEPRRALRICAGPKQAVIQLDFLIHMDGNIAMLIKYAPGSIVTRERPVLAMGRTVSAAQVPVAVVTNGEDAHVLDGRTGHLIGTGLDAIPDWQALEALMKTADCPLISPQRAEMEFRIIYAYEVDGSCPCDDTICRLPE